MQDCDLLKFINHVRKITKLQQSNELWFQNVLWQSGMRYLCKTDYVTVNHGMINGFVERWHTEMSSFHIPHGETFITMDDVSCLLYLPIKGNF